MKRILFVSLLVLQSALLCAQSFSFVYLPDIHLRPDPEVKAGFEKMVSVVNTLHPDFVLTGGDMIYTAKTVNGQKAAVLFDFMDKEFKLFKMPVKMTMGNHENVGITAESGIDKTDKDWGKQMFEKRYQKRYYSFVFNGWKFFILDGIKILEKTKNYTEDIDPEQIEWIKKELKSTDKNTPLVISMHTPFIDPNSVVTSKSKVMPAICDTVLNMFKEYNLKMVLEGHTHRYMNLFYHGIYYLSGGSSEINTDKEDHGFLQVRVKDNVPAVNFVGLPAPAEKLY
jgi:3',5'-cyclic AMP phosphodiesterase CpdA